MADDLAVALSKRLERCLGHSDEIRAAFAQDYLRKAEAVTALVDLALLLSPEQMAAMDRGETIPITALSGQQRALLAGAEPAMRELGFVQEGQTLDGATVHFASTGQMWFAWGEPPTCRMGLNWLPYSQCDYGRQEGLRQAQEHWRGRREWLVGLHYADFRQAADCGRVLFRLALSLTRDQAAAMFEGDGIPVASLRPEQQALLEVGMALYPSLPPGDLHDCRVRFEPHGQFRLIHAGPAEGSRSGAGWLPYSWK